MFYTLRYTAEAPIQPRPHQPTIATFNTYAEAVEHLNAQPNHELLEVVER